MQEPEDRREDRRRRHEAAALDQEEHLQVAVRVQVAHASWRRQKRVSPREKIFVKKQKKTQVFQI